MRKAFLLLLMLVLPLCTLAWNYNSHVLIASIAYDNLTPIAKERAIVLANLLMQQLSTDDIQYLDSRYPNENSFSKLAGQPDRWRDLTINELFSQFNATIPTNLQAYSQNNTKTWHFMDVLYPTTLGCPSLDPNEKNIIWAINTIKPDIANNDNVNSQAILMVLLEHFIGDLYQPLHTISKVTQNCQDDSGGNRFCLKTVRPNQRCNFNLHQLWDSGVGYTKGHPDIAKLANELQTTYPISNFAKQLANPDLMSVVNSNQELAPFIYNTVENSKPTSSYYRQGQIIAQKQLVQAGYRLAAILNQIFT